MTMRSSRKNLAWLTFTLVLGLATTSGAQTVSPADGKAATLTGTPWRLVDLDGTPIPNSGFEPHFILGSGSLLNASDGCNKIMGGYSAAGDSLRIHVVASTLLGCPPSGPHITNSGSPAPGPAPRNLPESFVKALSETVRFRIQGSTLELLNEDGDLLARMQVAKQI